METQLLIKIIHMSAASLLILVVLARAFTLFSGTQGNLPNPVARKAFVALQHLSLTVVAFTGLVALYLKDFDVQPWFYAKVILFFVMLSSLIKAYKKDDTVQLVQRRAGLFIAIVSLISLVALVIIKPNFG